MERYEVKRILVTSGVAGRCWPDAGTKPAEYRVNRVPHSEERIDLVRYPDTGGQQSCMLVRPPAAGEAGIVLTNAQWQILCELADAT